MNKELTFPKIIRQIISNELFECSEELHFSWDGCDYCSPNIGNTVYSFKGYLDLKESQTTGRDNLYEFQICGECLIQLYFEGF